MSNYSNRDLEDLNEESLRAGIEYLEKLLSGLSVTIEPYIEIQPPWLWVTEWPEYHPDFGLCYVAVDETHTSYYVDAPREGAD